MNFLKNIIIPSTVSFKIDKNLCIFSGPNGVNSYKLHDFLKVKIDNSNLCLYSDVSLLRKRDLIFLSSIFNTTYVILKNCILGVTKFFEYFLILRGVGYKVSYDKKTSMLVMLLGYSHPINLSVPSDILIELPSNSEIVVKSIFKDKAGQFAADIRELKISDIYKGNGIRYKDEKIVLKIPKKAK
ncbi:MAG TPA: 50S ribosomal protein L6 [Candidatus Azoamicus sp.]